MASSTLLRALILRLAALTFVGPIGRFVVGVLKNEKSAAATPPSTSCSKKDGGLKVIACGFPRSGTYSLQQALNILGYNCFHGRQFYQADTGYGVWSGNLNIWLRAATEANWNEWEKLLSGYDAIVDLPAAVFYKQLLAAYPNAKIILNVRDPDQWHRSCTQTIWWLHNKLLFQVLGRSKTHLQLVNTMLWEGKFKGRFAEKEFAISVYKSHVEEVKRVVPEENLLVHEAKDGWAPLCEFLQAEVPKTPYPVSNDAASFRRAVKEREKAFAAFSVMYCGFLSWAFAMCFRFVRGWTNSSSGGDVL